MMSKTRGRHQQTHKTERARPRWIVPTVIVGAVVILGAFLLWLFNNQQQPNTVSSDGTPRVQVDQTALDYGDVHFDTPVESVFQVSNVGDQTLTIIEEPQVELVEGC
jgi:hypothetical protein